jgi:hypothetical protein
MPRDTLDREDRLASDPLHGDGAGGEQSAVDDHRAGAAYPLPAGVLGAGEARLIPQVGEKRPPALRFYRDAVQGESDHFCQPLIAAQPTRGVDISATGYIHQRLLGQRDAGTVEQIGLMMAGISMDEALRAQARLARSPRRPAALPYILPGPRLFRAIQGVQHLHIVHRILRWSGNGSPVPHGTGERLEHFDVLVRRG